MSTRTQLQNKSIAELREIADAVGVPSDGLQKSKLISALMAAGGMSEGGEEENMVDLPVATSRPDDGRIEDGLRSDSDAPDDLITDEAEAAGESEGDTGEAGDEGEPYGEGADRDDFRGNRRRRRRRGGGPGGQRSRLSAVTSRSPKATWRSARVISTFSRRAMASSGSTATCPATDVYVSAGQVRKFGLRKADLVVGPVRPARAQEKFPALIRIDTVNGMTSDEAHAPAPIRAPHPALSRSAAPARG